MHEFYDVGKCRLRKKQHFWGRNIPKKHRQAAEKERRL